MCLKLEKTRTEAAVHCWGGEKAAEMLFPGRGFPWLYNTLEARSLLIVPLCFKKSVPGCCSGPK